MTSSSGEVPTIVIPGAHPKLYNHDLAPTAPEGRTWGAFSLFAMWMSDVHSVGGYTFAASLFFLGLTGWQVLSSMLVGITAVYFLMNLIGAHHCATEFRSPSWHAFRLVLWARTWLLWCEVWWASSGTACRHTLLPKQFKFWSVTLVPSAEALTHNSIIGLSTLAWLSFLFMWFFQLVIFLSGMERIRRFIDFCGPVVYVVMFILAIWMLYQAGFSSLAVQLSPPASSNAATVGVMANAAMLIVAYFSALLLNFGDFARFGKDEAAMKAGNFWACRSIFLCFQLSR